MWTRGGRLGGEPQRSGVLLFVDLGGLLAAPGMTAAGVVAVTHRNTSRRHVAASGQAGPPRRVSRLRVALNDSARALSALVPTAPIDWLTPSSAQTRA